MKKILLMLVILLVGCTPKEEINKEENKLENNNEIKQEEIIKEEHVDNNPIKLGLYLYTGSYSNKEKLSTYETTFVSGSDIGSFEVFFTDEEVISGNSFKSLFFTIIVLPLSVLTKYSSLLLVSNFLSTIQFSTLPIISLRISLS